MTGKEALSGAVDILLKLIGRCDLAFHDLSGSAETLLNSLLKPRMKVLMKSRFFRFIMIFSETVGTMQGYRTLALNRGEKLGVLKVGFEHATDRILCLLCSSFQGKNAHIDEVVQQSVKKKVLPSIERRIRTELTEKAEEGAIQLFSDNLRNLLLVAPLKGRVVLI